MEILKNPGVVIKFTNKTATRHTIGKNKRMDVIFLIESLFIAVTSCYCFHNAFLCQLVAGNLADLLAVSENSHT